MARNSILALYLALIGAPQIPSTGREITAAAPAVINFAIDYAPILEVNPERAAVLATIMLALAINALNNKHAIAATNVIHPDRTTTSSPSSTSNTECMRLQPAIHVQRNGVRTRSHWRLRHLFPAAQCPADCALQFPPNLSKPQTQSKNPFVG